MKLSPVPLLIWSMIEHWGSGIPRIIGRVKALGLAEPEFIGGEVDLRINIYRNQINGTNTLQHSANGTETADKLLTNCR